MKNFIIKKQINSKLLNQLINLNNRNSKKVLIKILLENKLFKNFIKNCEKSIFSKKVKGILISFNPKYKKINLDLMTIITECTSRILGELQIQNENKDQIIFVYDRDRDFSMHKGSRYHQTREGGSIHTDNVNMSNKWDYMVLSCLSNANVGGENILVNSDLVYSELKKYKLALKILKKNFIWERKGITKTFYKAPVLSINKKKEPEFRYLRPYMLSAYNTLNKKLTSKQLYSLDVLDAILENSENQLRINMKPGDLLLAKDSQLFHGRASFSDHYDAKSIFDSNNGKNLKRTMIRAWIKK